MNSPQARRDGLRVKSLADGRLAVYDERAEQGHLLGPQSAAVYLLADGTRTLTDLTAAVARVRPPADTAAVRLALGELTAAGLLDTPLETPPGARPSAPPGPPERPG
ncbi:hypothetical protein ABZX65_16780 [Streptomyces sp. NPDC003300]|uniref:hypothetical protein n=1 Tax=unclassified Streptomyces TaxID=2593676 RepID=UPI0033B90056